MMKVLSKKHRNKNSLSRSRPEPAPCLTLVRRSFSVGGTHPRHYSCRRWSLTLPTPAPPPLSLNPTSAVFAGYEDKYASNDPA